VPRLCTQERSFAFRRTDLEVVGRSKSSEKLLETEPGTLQLPHSSRGLETASQDWGNRRVELGFEMVLKDTPPPLGESLS